MEDRLGVSRALLTVALATVVLGAAVPPSSAVADPGRSAPQAAKKKAKRCPKGRVPVAFAGRRSCQPLRSALPRPRRGDRRAGYINAALDFDVSKLRDKHGHRGPSLKQVFRRQLGPKALPLLKRAIPKAIAMLDQARSASAATRATRRAHAADGQFMPTPDGFSVSVGDLKLEVRLALAGQLAAEFALTRTKSGKRVRTTVRPYQDSQFKWSCPDDKGMVEAKDGVKVSISVEVMDSHDRVDSYFTESIVQSTTMTGKVGDDGKLQTVELQDRFGVGENVGGPGSEIGVAGVEATIVRKTTIDMKTKSYEAGQSSVTGRSQVSGLLGLFQSQFQSAGVARLKKAADDSFAKTAAKAIADFGKAQERWNTPNTCVKISFDPESMKRKVKARDTGTVKATLSGVKAPNAAGKWTLSSSENGTFSPAQGQGHSLSINYTVAGAKGAKITARYRVVGRSGVAEDSWTQDIEGGINHISGTIQGSIVEALSPGDSRLEWQGTAAFDLDPSSTAGSRLFKTASGQYTVTASGFGSFGCQQAGTKQFTLSAGDGGLFIPNLTADPEPPLPYQYSFGAAVPGPTSPTMDVLLSSCPDKQDNGKTDTIKVPVVYDSNGFPTTADGVDFSGSWSETRGQTTQSQTWSFHGTP